MAIKIGDAILAFGGDLEPLKKSVDDAHSIAKSFVKNAQATMNKLVIGPAGVGLGIAGAALKPLKLLLGGAATVVKGAFTAIQKTVSLAVKGIVATIKTIAGAIKFVAEKVLSLGTTIAKVMIAAGVAVVGFVALSVRQFAKTGDALDKIALKLGIHVEELQKLRFAAERTGVASGALDIALQRQTRRLSEAAQGTGTAVKALDELGLSAEDLVNKSPDQAFLDIADAMDKIPNRADQVRLAFALWDTEGVGLVQTIQGGADAVRQLGDEAERLGGVMDKDATDAAAKLTDKITDMKTAFGGLITKVGELASPLFADFADAQKDAFLRWREAIIKNEDKIKAFVKTLRRVFNDIRTFAEIMRVSVLEAFKNGPKAGLDLFIKATDNSLPGLRKTFESLRDRIIELAKDVRDWFDITFLGENGLIAITRERIRLLIFWLDLKIHTVVIPLILDMWRKIKEVSKTGFNKLLFEIGDLFNFWIQSNPALAKLLFGLDVARGFFADTTALLVRGPVGDLLGSDRFNSEESLSQPTSASPSAAPLPSSAGALTLNVTINGVNDPEGIWAFLKPKIVAFLNNPPTQGMVESEGAV